MKLYYLPCTLACVLALSAPVMAADSTPNGALSLQDCIKIAMQNQTDIIVAQNNVRAARSRSDKAFAGYLPQISIQNNAFVSGIGSVLSKSTTGTAGNVSLNIFDGGLRELNNVSAKYGVAQSKAQLNRTTQTTMFNVTKAYYNVLRARRLAEVAEANVKYNQGLKEQVETRAQLGSAAQVDVLPVEAQLANAQLNRVTAKNSVRTSMLDLQSAIGMNPNASFDVQDVGNVPEPEIGMLQEYVKQAEGSRPDIQSSKASAGMARAAVKSAWINIYPRPVISGNYQKGIEGGFTSSGGQVIGGIVFNLFDGGANRAALREAQAQRANAEQQEKQVQRDILVQVEEAYLNLTSSREKLAASKVSLESAQKNYDVQRDRYNQGLAITLDLINAELQVITAQTNEVQSRYDYYTAISQLNYATGK